MFNVSADNVLHAINPPTAEVLNEMFGSRKKIPPALGLDFGRSVDKLDCD